MSPALALIALIATQSPDLETALVREQDSLQAEKEALLSARTALREEQDSLQKRASAEATRLAGQLEVLRIEFERLDAERRRADRRNAPAPRSKEAANEALRRELGSHARMHHEHDHADEGLSPASDAVDSGDLTRIVLDADLWDRDVRTSTDTFFGLDGRPQSGEVVSLGAFAAFGRGPEVQGPLQRIGARWSLAEHADVGRLFEDAGNPLVPLIWGTPHEGAGDERPPFFASRLEAGGSVAIAIALLAALALLVFAERLLRLALGTRDDGDFVEPYASAIAAGETQAAALALKDRSGWVASLARTRLELADRPKSVRLELMQAALGQQIGSVERGINLLKLVAAVAPLLGLLGTVMGMIETFDVLGTHGSGDARLLSSGISKALVTTELGLIVAIPALFAHSLVQSWVDRVVERLERVGIEGDALSPDRDDEAAP